MIRASSGLCGQSQCNRGMPKMQPPIQSCAQAPYVELGLPPIDEETEPELKPSTVNLALEVLLELVSIPSRGQSLVEWCHAQREKTSESPLR